MADAGDLSTYCTLPQILKYVFKTIKVVVVVEAPEVAEGGAGVRLGDSGTDLVGMRKR